MWQGEEGGKARWEDRSTLHLLRYLLRHWRSCQVLTQVAVRDELRQQVQRARAVRYLNHLDQRQDRRVVGAADRLPEHAPAACACACGARLEVSAPCTDKAEYIVRRVRQWKCVRSALCEARSRALGDGILPHARIVGPVNNLDGQWSVRGDCARQIAPAQNAVHGTKAAAPDFLAHRVHLLERRLG